MEINRQLFTSSTYLQNRSFLVIHWTRTTSKCAKMKNVRAKCAKVLNVQICDVQWCRRGCLYSLLVVCSVNFGVKTGS